MPNIRSQSLTPDGLTIVASDGRSVTITLRDILANFVSQRAPVGTPLADRRDVRKQQTRDWIAQQIEAALTEQVTAASVGSDFDDTGDGAVSGLVLH